MICADSLRATIMGAILVIDINEGLAVDILVRAHRRISCAAEVQ